MITTRILAPWINNTSSSGEKNPIETHWKPLNEFQWAKYLIVQWRSSIGRPFSGASLAKKSILKTAGSHFAQRVAILETRRLAVLIIVKQKISSRSREPIIVKRFSHLNIVLRSQKRLQNSHRIAVLLFNEAIVKRGATVIAVSYTHLTLPTKA